MSLPFVILLFLEFQIYAAETTEKKKKCRKLPANQGGLKYKLPGLSCSVQKLIAHSMLNIRLKKTPNPIFRGLFLSSTIE